ncbi:LOW QUALITY PROTEIN: hypothetical protein U9M48_000936 [Paspalum notatum var. saurae]|uniref:Cytochrome P450 n=1 Tax=Paspalum notatum var. saurae TaxID=547442 RepID=A0AAQ3PNE6_PASNO
MAFFLLHVVLLLHTLLFVFSTYVLQLFHDSCHRIPPTPRGTTLPHAARHGPLMSVRLGAVLTVRHNADIAARSIGDSMRACGNCESSVLSVLCLPLRRKWRALRRLGAAELFSLQRLAATRPLRQEAVTGLVRCMSDHAARGVAVDPSRAGPPVVHHAAQDPGMAREVSDVVDEALVVGAHHRVAQRVVLLPGVRAADLHGVRRIRMARLVWRMCAIIDEQIEWRMQNRTAGEDYLLHITVQCTSTSTREKLEARHMIRRSSERLVIGGNDDDNEERTISFSGTNFELIPFGAGRRICLGMPFAERMLHLMLASLLHRFD